MCIRDRSGEERRQGCAGAYVEAQVRAVVRIALELFEQVDVDLAAAPAMREHMEDAG